MTVNSTHYNVTAPLPPRTAVGEEEVVDLRVLVDGEQFEIFGLGGRANVALRARPDYTTSTLGMAFADCGSSQVRATVRAWSMDTAYEDDDAHSVVSTPHAIYCCLRLMALL